MLSCFEAAQRKRCANRYTHEVQRQLVVTCAKCETTVVRRITSYQEETYDGGTEYGGNQSDDDVDLGGNDSDGPIDYGSGEDD